MRRGAWSMQGRAFAAAAKSGKRTMIEGLRAASVFARCWKLGQDVQQLNAGQMHEPFQGCSANSPQRSSASSERMCARFTSAMRASGTASAFPVRHQPAAATPTSISPRHRQHNENASRVIACRACVSRQAWVKDAHRRLSAKRDAASGEVLPSLDSATAETLAMFPRAAKRMQTKPWVPQARTSGVAEDYALYDRGRLLQKAAFCLLKNMAHEFSRNSSPRERQADR